MIPELSSSLPSLLPAQKQPADEQHGQADEPISSCGTETCHGIARVGGQHTPKKHSVRGAFCALGFTSGKLGEERGISYFLTHLANYFQSLLC